MSMIALLMSLLLVAGQSPPAAKQKAHTLTSRGYDTIRIGMRPQDVRGYTLTGEPETQECRYFTAKEAPDLVMIVERGVITRISIQRADGGRPRTKTARGIGIGASEAQVRARYERLQRKPAKYLDPPATDLTWLPDAAGPGLRFNTDEKRRVVNIHASVEPTLGYVEGCL